MAFNFRKTIHLNSESFGTIRFSSGKKIYFEKEGEVRFVPKSSFWISPRTNQKYPLVWNLSTQKDSELHLTIEPFFEDQEFDSRSTTGFSYWEGAVKVKGTRSGKSVQGTGLFRIKRKQKFKLKTNRLNSLNN